MHCIKSSLIAIEFLLAVKPEQALRVDREGSTLLHLAVRRFCVLSCEETVQIERVWRLNPAAVCATNHEGLTPLHLAARYNHDALMCECFWEFSVDQIASAFAMVESPLEGARALIDKHCESPLVGALGRDVASIVYLYFLGFEL